MGGWGQPTLPAQQITARAQAEGYRRIMFLILTGEADRDPGSFLGKVKTISQEQSEKGA